MTSESLKSKLSRWRGDSTKPSVGFFAWVSDVQPRVPSSAGGYEIFTADVREREEIAKALDGDFSTIIFCWPRRHGKTLVAALITVWRFVTKPTQTIGIVANSQKQTVDTAFKLVKTIVEQTPDIAAMVKRGAIKIGADNIRYNDAGSVIQGYPANADALYGIKFSVAQCSELHAARDDKVFQTLASGTIDTDDGIVLIDSTTGSRTSPLYSLFQTWEHGNDPTLFVSYVSYRDIDDACDNAPRWIKPAKLRSRAAQMLPVEFSQQHLNQWTSGSNSLFPAEIIERCIGEYPLDVAAITEGAAYAVGAGLDRAYGWSVHGDATVTTAILKTLQGEDEHIYVLASDAIKFSSAKGIKKAFTKYQTDFDLKRAAIETYNSQDIASWCGDQSFDHEIIHPTSERQANAFTAIFNAANEGRLHIHPTFEKLFKEMATFEYGLEASGTSGKGSVPRFGHAKGANDDHVYSLAWAIYALRADELNPYEVSGIHCYQHGPTASICLLNGGDLVPPCSESCRSFNSVRGLHKAYEAREHLFPLDLTAFFDTKVTNVGSHTAPR